MLVFAVDVVVFCFGCPCVVVCVCVFLGGSDHYIAQYSRRYLK